MSGLEIAFGIVLLVFAVGIIAIVLLQEGQQRNPGVITGGSSDTFLSKHQGRQMDKVYCGWIFYFRDCGQYYFVFPSRACQCRRKPGCEFRCDFFGYLGAFQRADC